MAGLAGLLLGAVAWADVPSPGAKQGRTEPPPARASTPAAHDAARPGLVYRSAFEGYRRFRADEPLRDWREVNEEVRDAGGHIGILKGAAAGEGDAHAHLPEPRAPKEAKE